MKSKIWLTLVVFTLVLAFALACTSRKRFVKEFNISSNPAGAEVLVDGEPVGNTPVNVRMKFEINLDFPDQGLIRHEVIVKLDGYQTKRKSVYHNDPERVHFELLEDEAEPPPPDTPPPPPPPRLP